MRAREILKILTDDGWFIIERNLARTYNIPEPTKPESLDIDNVNYVLY